MTHQHNHDSIPLIQQPTVYPDMTARVAGGDRNAKGKEIHKNGQRDWSYSLCECCGDYETCVLALICPCVIYSQNKSRLDHLDRQRLPHADGGNTCTTDCGLWICLGAIGLSWILQMKTRGEIRKRYKISGNGCGDCVTSCICVCCGLTQESRELELEEQTYH